MRAFRLLALLLLLTLMACGAPLATPTPIPTPTPLPTPTPPPSPESTAKEFFNAWEKGNYEAMYRLTASVTKTLIPQEQFVKRYRDIAAEATLTGIKVELTGLDRAFNKAQANFTVTYDTNLVGTFKRDNRLPMTLENDGWRIDWSPVLIFPELGGDNRVHMFVQAPPRGTIYDRHGRPLATQEKRVMVGVVPGEIQDEKALLAALRPVLGMTPDEIKAKYENAARPDWFMPVKDISLADRQKYAEVLTLPGVSLRDTTRRYYPNGMVAAQLIGYLGLIDATELARLAPLGYLETDRLGKAGLEKWGESYLAGKRGGTLTIITPDGNVVATLQKKEPGPAQDLHTTLDLDFQKAVEDVLGDRVGAAVVLDPRNGEILAMASAPRYDANILAAGPSGKDWDALLKNKDRPLVNRATQGAYPTGSIFKIVTMTAGLERGGYTPNSGFQCNGEWRGLGDKYVKRDWLAGGHGRINLFQGLVQSCNIVFYTVGLALDQADRSILPTYARAFGFGAVTGAPGLADEAAGRMPDPTRETVFVGDMVNVAIGQGDLLATPLQVANLLATVANNGTRLRPRLVAQASGQSPVVFQPEEVAKVPVAPANLQSIKQALKQVTATAPGTAARAFKGYPIAVAGKTGTAETQGDKPHAWFAAYAPADAPRVTVVVIVEKSGEGSEFAAPLARQIFDRYFAIFK